MNLDWCGLETIDKFSVFNDMSIINTEFVKAMDVDEFIEKKEKEPTPEPKKITKIEQVTKYKKCVKINDCFSLNLETTNKINILEILSYLSGVSNELRTLMKDFSGEPHSMITVEKFDMIKKYISWLDKATLSMQKYFVYSVKEKNDNYYFKPFKTSSYKFCVFKADCVIHKNKNKKCGKNHFVFDMILTDIDKLIKSLNIISQNGIDDLNWIFSNNILKITCLEHDTYRTERIKECSTNTCTQSINDVIIDRNSINKCFDVISYVLNKIYEEAYVFLNFDIKSYQILL